MATKKTTKKTTKKKHPGGRPTKWSEVNKEVLRFAYENGATDLQAAKMVGVEHQTLYNWKKKYPEFFESLKDWKVLADAKVEKSLYQRAHGYSCEEEKVFCDPKTGKITTKTVIKHYPPDPTAMIFWLKNRQPKEWRDKREVELSQEDNKSFSFKLEKSPDDVDK